MNQQSRPQLSQEAGEARVKEFRDALGPFVVAAETTRMPMVFTDAQIAHHPIVFANDSLLALTGFAREALLGKELAFLLGNVTDTEAKASIQTALDIGADGTWETPCRRIDGSEFPAAVYLSPVRDKHGVIRQNFLSFVDLGSHVERLSKERNELHALYEQAPGFIATAEGAEHRFTFANASYERLVGLQHLVGKTVAEAMPEIAEQGFIDRLDDVYATGKPFVGINMPIRLERDGQDSLRYIDFVYQPIRDANHRITGLFCEGYDVTEQKLARDEVLALQTKLFHVSRVSALETMATALAHELNQPLAAVASYAAGGRRLIMAGNQSDSKILDVLAAIEESSTRAGDIIRHLRNLISRREPQRETFEVKEVVAECLQIINASGCEMIEIDDRSVDGVTLQADRVQIQQVIINLLRNACEATYEAGNRLVTIATSAADGHVTLLVSDSGFGVPEGFARSGFEWTESRKPGGMGVGLSISRTIVEAHGGALWVEASSREGATFAFSLPSSSTVA
ncbi:PAS domain-containing protein [Sphingomonas koreensis]|nr:PAS domain-containing protein [Sphingomonas koreensis]